jgi:DNA-binding PadR family transcriptional regulator
VLRSRAKLTDHEATLLALVARAEPITAYQIAKVYEESPVSNFNTSRGTIYPIIRRLREADFLRAELVEGDARRTEQLQVTGAGREAIRNWVKEMRPAHLLPEDPLRTKIQSFDLLSRDERISWIAELKVQLLNKLQELERYGDEVSVPYHEFVQDNAVRSIRSRMDWLDRLLHRVVQESASTP